MEIFAYFIFALLLVSAAYNLADGAYLKIELIVLTVLGLISYSLAYSTLFDRMSDDIYSPFLKIMTCLALHLIAVLIFYMKYRKYYSSNE